MKWRTCNFFDEVVNSLKKFAIGILPMKVILPSLT